LPVPEVASDLIVYENEMSTSEAREIFTKMEDGF